MTYFNPFFAKILMTHFAQITLCTFLIFQMLRKVIKSVEVKDTMKQIKPVEVQYSTTTTLFA
jgi:hypothetical protein